MVRCPVPVSSTHHLVGAAGGGRAGRRSITGGGAMEIGGAQTDCADRSGNNARPESPGCTPERERDHCLLTTEAGIKPSATDVLWMTLAVVAIREKATDS